TQRAYPSEKTIHLLFEEQAARQADKIAVSCQDEQLTYSALNSKSNQVGYALRERGIAPNEIIALLTDRSSDTLVGMLGILKSGAAYLPIDTTYPVDRIHFMLADSGCNQVVTHRQHQR